MRTFAVVVASLLAFATGRAEDEPLRVTVTPETRFLRSGDPLLLKVVIENRGDTDASIVLPSRKFCSLGIYVEFKPNANHFYAASEWGDAAEVPVEHELDHLRPRQQFVTYDRLFRSTDGDFVFRMDGDYRIYVVVSQSDGAVVKSPPISVAVTESSRDITELIDTHAELLARAIRVERAKLAKGADVQTLRELHADLPLAKSSNWHQTLEWRIPIFQLKYGSDEERQTATRSLDELTAQQSLSPVRREVLNILRAQIAVERNELSLARRYIKTLPDSGERRRLELQVKEAEKKHPPVPET